MNRPLLLAFFVFAASCSSNSGDSTTAGDRSGFISKFCDQYMPCCAKAGRPSDGAQCRAFYGAFSNEGTYDAAAGSACLSEIKANSSSPTFCENGISGSNAPSCSKVFSQTDGTKKPGETCASDSECAPSSEGDVDCRSLFKDGATIKKCQVQITGKAGDTPCLGTVDGNLTSYNSSGDTDILPRGYLCDIADGIRCDSATDKCVAIAKVGEACEGFGSNLCTKDAYCDTTLKKCAARKPIGEACTSDHCVEGAYCNTTTKVCTAAIAVGAACKSSTECISRSCVNGTCAKSGGGTDLTAAFLCGGG
jgi:hypothetical protein